MLTDEYRKMYEHEQTHWWYQGLHELVEHFVRARKSGEPLSMLDAGCGTGRMMEILGRHGTVDGFDCSQEAVSYCRKRGLSRLDVVDLGQWVPEACSYDLVTCLDVICCLDDEQYIGSFHRLASAIRPGGVLLLNLPAFHCLRREHDLAVGSKRRFRRKEVEAELVRSGLTPIVSTYRLPLLFPLILSMKALSPLKRARPVPESDLSHLPGWINELLLLFNRIENRMITSGFRLPFGSSLFVVAEKPGPRNGFL